jgi:hypothetical protein
MAISRVEKGRDERVGLGMFRRKMTLPDGLISPGYVPRWINDTGNRLEDAQKAGYEFVFSEKHIGEGVESANTDIGSRVSKVVDKSPRLGNPMRAYLMQIKKEWYDNDQKEKLGQVEAVDDTIKRGKYAVGEKEKGAYYGKTEYQP